MGLFLFEGLIFMHLQHLLFGLYKEHSLSFKQSLLAILMEIYYTKCSFVVFQRHHFSPLIGTQATLKRIPRRRYQASCSTHFFMRGWVHEIVSGTFITGLSCRYAKIPKDP